MKKQWIHLIMAVTVVCCAQLACSNKSDKFNNEEGQQQLSELGKMMRFELPPGSRIVYAESNERNNEAYTYHIIFSPTPAKFDRQPDIKLPSETSIEVLKKAPFRKDLGKLKNEQTYCFSGSVDKGEWKAYQTNFETGSYLEIMQIFRTGQPINTNMTAR